MVYNKTTNGLPSVSIIVPVYNSEKNLSLCLNSLVNLDYPKDKIEIIVVDNNSTDRTKEIIENYPVRYAFESYPTSYAARNKGISIAKGELVAFTDADCVANKNWIKNLITPFIDPMVGGAGGEILPASELKGVSANPELLNQEKSIKGNLPQKPPYIVTANAIFRKDILKIIGMFDASLASGGDSELGWRLYWEGYKLHYIPESIVYHFHRNTLLKIYKQFFFYGYGYIKRYRKHASKFEPMILKKATYITFKEWKNLSYLLIKSIIPCNGRKTPLALSDFIRRIALSSGKISANLQNRKRTIAYFPNWSKTNSYQKLLYQHLFKEGFYALPENRFGVSWLFKNIFWVKFIHFHWLEGVCDLKKKRTSSFKTLTFFYLRFTLAKILGYKIIWTVHNYLPHDILHTDLEKKLRRFVAKFSNSITVHCNYAKGWMEKEYNVNARKIFFVPHGNYINYYPNVASKKEARNRLNLEDNAFVYLYFGAVRPYKGLEKLISSFSEIESTEIKLIIAGNPMNQKYVSKIEGLSEKDRRISLYLKFIPDEEVQYFFNSADIVVLPYQDILTSGTAILALSFKKGVIAPAIGCLPELINEKNGVLYNPQKDDLREILLSAMKIAKETGFEKSAFDTASKLGWDRVALEYKKILSLL